MNALFAEGVAARRPVPAFVGSPGKDGVDSDPPLVTVWLASIWVCDAEAQGCHLHPRDTATVVWDRAQSQYVPAMTITDPRLVGSYGWGT